MKYDIQIKFKGNRTGRTAKIKVLKGPSDAVRGFSSGIILIGGDIPLNAADFFAGGCTETVVDSLPEGLDRIAAEAIHIVDTGVHQVKEISRIFPKRRADYIRIHNEESRRIMKRMAKQCRLKKCSGCGKYFFIPFPRCQRPVEMCPDCNGDFCKEDEA